MLSVKTLVNSPVPSHCYVLYDKDVGKECIIIDPGSKDEVELFTLLEKEELTPKYIILTHEHFDHCWGVNQLVEWDHIPIVCSQLCAEAIKNEKRNCSMFYDNKEAFVIDSKTISTESIDFELIFSNQKISFYLTPGHTDASISFVIGKYLFTGDTLIKDLRTVTKLPTGSVGKLKESLSVYTDMQGEGYVVYPGHGDSFDLDEYELNNNWIF